MSKKEELIKEKETQLARLGRSIEDLRRKFNQAIELHLKLVGAIAGLKELGDEQEVEENKDAGSAGDTDTQAAS